MAASMTKATRELPREEVMLRPADVQRRLGLARSTVYELIWAGQLPSMRVGRAILIPAVGLDDFLAQQDSAAKRLAG